MRDTLRFFLGEDCSYWGFWVLLVVAVALLCGNCAGRVQDSDSEGLWSIVFDSSSDIHLGTSEMMWKRVDVYADTVVIRLSRTVVLYDTTAGGSGG